jgi:hypothetical protein
MDLDTIAGCARVSTQAIKSELSELKKGLNEMEREIDFVENYYLNKDETPEDYFTSIMKDFLGDANEQYEIIEKKWELIESKIEELGKYYGEDPNKYKFEEFIQSINNFIIDWKTSIQDCERKKEIERKKLEKEKKQQEEKEKKEEQRKLKQKDKVVVEEKKEEKVEEVIEEKEKKVIDLEINKNSEGGVLDDLTQSMLEGAFGQKKKKKKKNDEKEKEDLLKQLEGGGEEKKKKKKETSTTSDDF